MTDLAGPVGRAMGAVCAMILVLSLAVEASAQQRNTRVSRANSILILDMPGLEGGRDEFHYFGWNSQFSAETSLAAQVPASGNEPYVVVIMQQLGKGWLWRAARLDEAWVRSISPRTRDRKIAITQAAREGSSAYLNYMLFAVDDVPCAGFDFRRYAPGIADTGMGGEAGFSGVYCAKPGATITEADVQRYVAGVYIRSGGDIRRAYEVDKSPIPDRVRR